jgi:hypothetical protein
LNPIQHLQNTLAVFLKTIYNNSNSDSGWSHVHNRRMLSFLKTDI